MGWEYSDTDCKYANVCSFSPRCTARIDILKPNCYKKDDRSWFEKHFGNQMKLKAEFEIWEKETTKSCLK